MGTELLESTVLEAQSASFQLMGNIVRTIPDIECINQLATSSVFDEVPYANNQPKVKEGLSLLQRWASDYSEEDFDDLYSDYMSLLIGPGKPLASPWESVYNADDPGLVFQKETLEVRKDYQALGLQVDQYKQEPDDNIAYEMEFISVLCNKEIEGLESNNLQLAQDAQDAKARFAKRHPLSWGFEWCSRMTENAKTDFYRGVALLVEGFLSEVKAEIQ